MTIWAQLLTISFPATTIFFQTAATSWPTANNLAKTGMNPLKNPYRSVAAARLLNRARVTGAPVVDAEGRCVGVLSATDFIHWAEKGEKPAAGKETVCSPWQIFEEEELPKEVVLHYMTRDPVMVSSESPVGDLARMMLDAHIHRVIVVDQDRRPIGVVSSTDILAALANAARAADIEGKRHLVGSVA